jgi:hypothetical protein
LVPKIFQIVFVEMYTDLLSPELQDQVIARYYQNVWKRNHKYLCDEDKSKFASPESAKPAFKFTLTPSSESADAKMANGALKARPTSTPSSNHRFQVPEQSTIRHRRNTKQSDLQKDLEEPKEEAHVLMVDQLWLWIIDESTYSSPHLKTRC